jgi:catalase (peroxidase I)
LPPKSCHNTEGCVDSNNPDNAGLDEVVAEIDLLWRPFCSFLSKADFWVLAAKVAVEVTATAPITIPFRFGRTTAATCVDGVLPGAQAGISEIQRVMVDQMGLTMRESVALLGAHTLGRFEARNSGFEGTVRVFRLEFSLEATIGSHACSLEALTCVCPMPFLSGVHFSYQLTL